MSLWCAPRTTEAFEVTKGVKQLCVLTPTLFGLMFSAMLMDAYRDERPPKFASPTGWAANASILLLFAYDCEANTTTEEEMQRSMDLYASDCAHFGPTINTYRPVVTHRTQPNAEYSAACIRVSDNELKTVDNFNYLGSKVSRCIRIDGKVS
nr:unnamed protein product [Spirometra erinaceieuropaei]